jgi:hypothetical protein
MRGVIGGVRRGRELLNLAAHGAAARADHTENTTKWTPRYATGLLGRLEGILPKIQGTRS